MPPPDDQQQQLDALRTANDFFQKIYGRVDKEGLRQRLRAGRAIKAEIELFQALERDAKAYEALTMPERQTEQQPCPVATKVPAGGAPAPTALDPSAVKPMLLSDAEINADIERLYDVAWEYDQT